MVSMVLMIPHKRNDSFIIMQCFSCSNDEPFEDGYWNMSEPPLGKEDTTGPHMVSIALTAKDYKKIPALVINDRSWAQYVCSATTGMVLARVPRDMTWHDMAWHANKRPSPSTVSHRFLKTPCPLLISRKNWKLPNG